MDQWTTLKFRVTLKFSLAAGFSILQNPTWTDCYQLSNERFLIIVTNFNQWYVFGINRESGKAHVVKTEGYLSVRIHRSIKPNMQHNESQILQIHDNLMTAWCLLTPAWQHNMLAATLEISRGCQKKNFLAINYNEDYLSLN